MNFKKNIVLLFLCFMNKIPIAEEMKHEYVNKFGIGLDIAINEDIQQTSFSSIYFPIKLGKLKLEPEFGMNRVKFSSTEYTEKSILFGIGVLPKFNIKELVTYLGVRYKGIYTSIQIGEDDSANDWMYDFMINPSFGTEYYFNQF